MADIPVSFFEARKIRTGTSVSSPPTLEGETNPPVNPPNNGVSVSYLGLTDTKDSNYNGKNGFVPVVVNESELELQPLAEIEDYRLVSGGVVQWTGSGYVFNVSGAFYRIGGVGYSSLPDQVTLSAPDATNDRIDVIAVDTTGSVVVITGTPSATPIKPQINPTTQIELTSIIVTAASTDPILIEEVVYDQNTEWTGSSSGTGTASFNSAADPCNDTLSVETTNIQNGFYIEFDNGSEFDVSTVQTFGLLLKLKSNMPANQGLYLSLLDGTSTSVSKSLPLVFDKSNTTDCQFIGIDINTLNLISYGVQYVRFTFIRTSGTPTYGGYFMDLVKFEGGINPPVTAGSFISLTDTPSSYSGQASKVVSVKADESGLEFVTGGSGGVQSVTGDGVDNTDPDNPVIDLADIATSGSPYDLAQEGASDGDVLTWVAANSRYEPVAGGGGGITGSGTTNEIAYFTGATAIASLSTATYPSLTELSYVKGVTSSIQTQLASLGSKWTQGVGFIYNTGKVVVGQSTLPTNATFAVKSQTSGSANIFQVLDDSGTGLFNINNIGRADFQFSNFSIGLSATATNQFTYKGALTASTTTIFEILDSASTSIFRLGANGNTYWANHRVNIGTATAYPGFVYQSGSTSGANKDFVIRNSAGTEGFWMKGDTGVVILNPRLSIGSAAGSVTNGVFIQGNSNTAQLLGISNNSSVRIFDVYGNGNIGIYDSGNVILGTTTGTKFGTATTQKLAFWNKTPIIQPTTGITAAAFVANTSGIANDTATYGGYTMGQIAAALINTGILA